MSERSFRKSLKRPPENMNVVHLVLSGRTAGSSNAGGPAPSDGPNAVFVRVSVYAGTEFRLKGSDVFLTSNLFSLTRFQAASYKKLNKTKSLLHSKFNVDMMITGKC